MPIDFAPPQPNAQPFQVQPVQYTDPLQTLAQIGQLRTQGLQQQQAQLQVDQAQLQMKSNKAMARAFVTGGGDPDKTEQLIMTDPDVLAPDKIGFQQHKLDIQSKRAALTKEDLENEDHNNEEWSRILGNVQNQDELNQGTQAAVSRGLKPPIGMPSQFTDPEHMKAYANSLLLPAKLTDIQAKQQQTATSKAEADKAQAETEETKLKTQITQGQLDYIKAISATPQGLQELVNQSIDPIKYPDYNKRAFAAASNALRQKNIQGVNDAIRQFSEIASQQEKTKALDTDPDIQKAKESIARVEAQNRVTINTQAAAQQLSAGLGGGGAAGGLHGEEYLASINNPAVASRIRQIAAGGEALPTGRAAMSGPGAMLTNAVYQYDPDYTPLLAQKRKAELQDFSLTGAGHAGGNVVALNTMIHHADLYLETADALKNGTFKPGNAIWNKVKDTFGQAPPTQANLVAQFFAGETAKVAGEQSQGEVNKILESLKSSNSPDQIRGAGETLLRIASGRLIPYQERIADAKLQNLAPPVLGPSARAILQRRGYDPNTMQPGGAGLISVTAPDGSVHKFKTQADADKFKGLAGIK